LDRIESVCPRCARRPAVRYTADTAAAVRLNLRCEFCRREGVDVFYNVVLRGATPGRTIPVGTDYLAAAKHGVGG
jgi:hypothetical protein